MKWTYDQLLPAHNSSADEICTTYGHDALEKANNSWKTCATEHVLNIMAVQMCYVMFNARLLLCMLFTLIWQSQDRLACMSCCL